MFVSPPLVISASSETQYKLQPSPTDCLFTHDLDCVNRMMMYIFVPLLSPFRISLYYDLYDCSDDFCTLPRVCCQTDSKLPKSLLKLSLAEVIGHTLTLQHFVLMLMLEALSSCLDRFLPGSVLRSVMMLILFSTARMQCRYMVDNVIQNKSLSYTRSYSVLPWARE